MEPATFLNCRSPHPGAHLPFPAPRPAPPLHSSCHQQGQALPRFFKASPELWNQSFFPSAWILLLNLFPPVASLPWPVFLSTTPSNCRPIMILLNLKYSGGQYVRLTFTSYSLFLPTTPRTWGLQAATCFYR